MPDNEDGLFDLPDGGKEWPVTSSALAILRLSGKVNVLEQTLLGQLKLLDQSMAQQSRDTDTLRSDLRATKGDVEALDKSLTETAKEAAELFVAKAVFQEVMRPIKWIAYGAAAILLSGTVGAILNTAVRIKP